MTLNMTLEQFLENQEKLPAEQKTSEKKILLLKIAAQQAYKIYLHNNTWFFEFDEGVYKGSTQYRIHKTKLTALSLLSVLCYGTGKDYYEEIIFNILKEKFNTKNS